MAPIFNIIAGSAVIGVAAAKVPDLVVFEEGVQVGRELFARVQERNLQQDMAPADGMKFLKPCFNEFPGVYNFLDCFVGSADGITDEQGNVDATKSQTACGGLVETTEKDETITAAVDKETCEGLFASPLVVCMTIFPADGMSKFLAASKTTPKTFQGYPNCDLLSQDQAAGATAGDTDACDAKSMQEAEVAFDALDDKCNAVSGYSVPDLQYADGSETPGASTSAPTLEPDDVTPTSDELEITCTICIGGSSGEPICTPTPVAGAEATFSSCSADATTSYMAQMEATAGAKCTCSGSKNNGASTVTGSLCSILVASALGLWLKN